MAYKIRVQKKKEVTSLKIASRSEERLQALIARPKLVWGSLAVVVLIAALSFALRSMNQGAEEAAWTLEAQASKLFHEPPPLPEPIEEGAEEAPQVLLDPIERMKKSAEIYDQILEKHPRQSAASIALFESGNVYYALESYDKSEERLLSFLKKYPDRPGLIPLAHMKLAYLYLKKGEGEKAQNHLKTVYEQPDSPNKDQAGFELARALEADGKIDQALAIFSEVSSAFPQSPWGTEAKVRLTLLNPPKPDEVAEPGETSPDLDHSSDQGQDAVPARTESGKGKTEDGPKE